MPEVTPNAPRNSLVKAETAQRTARTGRVLWPRSPWTGPPSGGGDVARSQRVCFPTVLPPLRGQKRSQGPMAEPTQGGQAGAEHGPLTHGPTWGSARRAGRAAPRVPKAHCGEPTSLCALDSLGNGLDDLGGGVLDVGEEALGAAPQDVQEPAIGLVVLGDHQACKQRQALGCGRARQSHQHLQRPRVPDPATSAPQPGTPGPLARAGPGHHQRAGASGRTWASPAPGRSPHSERSLDTIRDLVTDRHVPGPSQGHRPVPEVRTRRHTQRPQTHGAGESAGAGPCRWPQPGTERPREPQLSGSAGERPPGRRPDDTGVVAHEGPETPGPWGAGCSSGCGGADSGGGLRPLRRPGPA